MKKSITILLAALLCACGFPIDKAEWTRAEEICAAQGGVSKVYQEATSAWRLSITCNSGIEVSTTLKKGGAQ